MIDLEPELAPDRAAFDLPRDVVWMNAAQMSALHAEVRAAGLVGVQRKARPWESPPASFFSELETARALFAALIGADAEGVAITPSASYGLETAARNLPICRGQAVLVVEGQFPSNVYPWRRAATACGGEVVIVARAPDGAITERLREAIAAHRDRLAAVACAAVHWSDATPVDLVAVGADARAAGAALVLDLTQSLGAAPFDAAAVRPDFIACATYKWLLGPYSFGFLWAAPHRRDGSPLEETWMNRADAENFAGLVDYRDGYLPGARRYDMGEKANFTLAPMAIAALRRVSAWGPARIAEALGRVTDRLADALAERGFAVPPPTLRSAHFFGVGLPPAAPADLAARLTAEKVFVSVRGAKMRVAPHLWIDAEDEARFLAAIDRQVGACR